MAGLLPQQNDDMNGRPDKEPDAQDAMEAAPGPTPPAPNQNGGKATPEQQQQFTKFMDNAYKLIYSDQVFPEIEKSLQGNGNPVDGLAQASTMVIMRLIQSIDRAGTKIDGAVIWHGGEGVVNELANLAAKLKIHTFTNADLKKAKMQVIENFKARNGSQGQAGPAPQGGAGAPAEPAAPGASAAPPAGGAGLLNNAMSKGVPG